MILFKPQLLIICLISFTGIVTEAQPAYVSNELSAEQVKALNVLSGFDTTKTSAWWPNIEPAAFYNNVRFNILHPEKIYQGHATNFCGYAALTVVLCQTQPHTYTQTILSLYTEGMCRNNDVTIKPSASVREKAGTLLGKGKLNINPADQLWLLSLPDHFKGYMNVLDKKYNPGDENKIWAAVTLAKFNRMARKLGGFKTHVAGADLIRPAGKNNFVYLQNELSKGAVVLYVNSKFLHPAKFRIYNLKAPTHFIVLYDINMADGFIAIKYWDYGLKTVQLMSSKRLRKLIFGIIRLNKE